MTREQWNLWLKKSDDWAVKDKEAEFFLEWLSQILLSFLEIQSVVA